MLLLGDHKSGINIKIIIQMDNLLVVELEVNAEEGFGRKLNFPKRTSSSTSWEGNTATENGEDVHPSN